LETEEKRIWGPLDATTHSSLAAKRLRKEGRFAPSLLGTKISTQKLPLQFSFLPWQL
jgi:hypothetical protein